MISSIKGISFKLIKSNPVVLASSVFTIILSVSLIINMFMFIINAEKSMRDSLVNRYGQMDMFIGYHDDANPNFTDETIRLIASIPDIDTIAKVIVGNLPIGETLAFRAYSVGVDNTELSKSRYKYKSDLLENEVILNQGLADSMGVSLGDTVKVDEQPYTVKEVLNDVIQSSQAPDILLININDYKSILKKDIEATHLLIKASDKNAIVKVASDIIRVDNRLTVDLIEENEFIQANINSFKTFIIMLSFLLVIMCCLFILTNFQTFLYNYRKQFSLIRAIGGYAKQALRIVFIQCMFINAIGVIGALIVSYFSSTKLIRAFSNHLEMAIENVVFYFPVSVIIAIAAFIIIQLFMLIPAIRSSRILPMKISEKNEVLEQKGNSGKSFALICIFIAIICFIMGIIRSSQNGLLFGIASCVFLLIGVYKWFPYLIKSILTNIIPLLQIVVGKRAFVSIKNLIPQVKKNSLIITSVSTILIISIFGSTFFNTILRNDEEYNRSQFALDIVVSDRNSPESTLDYTFKASIDSLRGVQASSLLSELQNLYFKKREGGLRYVEYCYADLAPLLKKGLIPKLYGDLRSGVIITKDLALKESLNIGDYIGVKKVIKDGKGIDEIDENSGFISLEIICIMDTFSLRPGASIILDWANMQFLNESTVFYKAIIATDNADNTIMDLHNLKRQYPQIKWAALQQVLKESRQMLTQRWTLFIILIVIIAASMILGILSTLFLYILNRRKEYALLRTLELSKAGLLVVMLTQSMVYVFLGVALGYILGTIMSNILTITENVRFAFMDYSLALMITLAVVFLSSITVFFLGSYLAGRKISTEIHNDG